MNKPAPGTRIIQKAGECHEYVVISDEETDQKVEEDRFAVRSLEPGYEDEIGTFPLKVLKQDNFFSTEE